MLLAIGALLVDLFSVVGLLFWWYKENNDDNDDGNNKSIFTIKGGLADSLGDLLLIAAPIRLIGLVISISLAKLARQQTWYSRSTFRSRVFIPKVVTFIVWTSSAMFALVKGLARVVESAETDFDPTISNTLFGVAVCSTMVLSYTSGLGARRLFLKWYEECQEARKLLRKERRGTVVTAAVVSTEGLTTPLLAAVGSRVDRLASAEQIAYNMTPSSYVKRFSKSSSSSIGNNLSDVDATLLSTDVPSDHDSDDDSSSDEEEKMISSVQDSKVAAGEDIENSRAVEKIRLRQLSRSMRASERGRRVRERRRKIKEEKDQKLETGASVRELLKFNAPDTLILLFAFCCLVVAAIAGAFIPKYTGEVINHVSGAHPDREAFKKSVYMLTLAAIMCGIFSGLRGATFTVAMARMNIRLRKALYRALLNMDQGFFDSTKLGDLSSRLSNNTTTVSDQIALNINVLMRSLVEGGIVLVMMFRLSWRLSLLSFAAIPLMTLISKLYGDYYRKLVNMTTDALADTSGVAEEALGAIGTVRDFGARRSERRVYSEELSWFYALNLKESIAYSGFALTWTAIPALVTALTLWEGGKLVLDRKPGTACGEDGALCSGDLVSFMLYSQSLTGSIEAVGSIFSGIASALGAADKIFDLLRQKPKVRPKGDDIPESEDAPPFDPKEDNEFKGTIELRDVSFRYPTRPTIQVLKNFNLKVDQGQIVALVGESGGGKSSVIKLILHHYEPEAGQVLISGRPVEDYDQQLLRRRMSVVNQEPTLFARSVLRNIVYGLEGCEDEPTFEEVVRAAKLANAHEFIMKLPKGYSTLLGERGSTLSGGQRQRLCIARALVRRPRILLLDESTSALDAESEAKVLEALDNVMRSGSGMSVLVVAHRLSTIKDSDNIVVVDKGTVAEQGKHDALLKVGGKYADLVKRQLQAATAVLQQ
jgi:ATP-binding cassette subfamily B (MDR/TAP) protein 9